MLPLLDEIEEGEAAVRVFLRDRDHEAEIGLDHLGLGLVGFADVDKRLIDDAEEFRRRDALLGLDLLDGAD